MKAQGRLVVDELVRLAQEVRTPDSEERGSILLSDFVSLLIHLPDSVVESLGVSRDEYVAA